MGVSIRAALSWLALGCAALAQTTLNLSQDLVPLRIASSNMVPNDPTVDAGPLFFRAVLYAQAHQISRIIADPGAYYFSSLQFPGTHVAWDSLSNLTIDLQGSELYFSNPLSNGILITHSSNIVLENFTTDYNPLPFTQVRVVSVNPAQQTVQFAVDGNWQNPSVLNAVFATGASEFGQGVEVHIFRNGRPAPGVTRIYAKNPVGTTQFTALLDPGVSPSTILSQIRPGDIAFLGMRSSGGPVSTLFCTRCTFRNITVYSGQISFLAGFSDSSVFERIYSIPRPATERLAGSFIGLVLTGMHSGNEVRLNRIIRQMDSGLEYNGLYIGTVKSQINSRTFVLEGSLSSLLSYGDSVPNGSPVAFQRISDGSMVASAVTASPVAPPYPGQPAYQVTFTFDRDLPASVVGTLVYSTDPYLRGGNSVIERNELTEATDCCAGMAVDGTLNTTFAGNYMERVAMAAFGAGNAVQPGNINTPPSTNFIVRNNAVDIANWIRTGYPLIQLGSLLFNATNSPKLLTTSPHQNISITGNFIADSGSAAVWLGNSNGGSVTGNIFLNSNNNPAVESAVSFFGPTQQPLVLPASQNIIVANNVVDQTWRRMWVTDGQYRELAAHAPGSTVRLNAYALATLFPSPSVMLTDADGKTIPLTLQNVTAHAIDVQIPASAALGGAYLTLTTGTVKYFGTLFLDGVDNNPALNGCTYEVSLSFPSTGVSAGNLPILVVTQPGCSYQVLTSATFVNPGAGGTGTGVISPGFTANPGVSRTATIEVAGQMFTVTQDAPGAAPSQPASIKAVGGDGQSGLAGFPLPNPVVVEVRDSLGNLLPGVVVNFAGTNATVSPVSVQTEAMGHAGALVTPAAPGAAQVMATVGGLPAATFNLTAAQPTTTLAIEKTWQAASGGNPLRGDTFTYSLKVTNSGNAPAAAVNVQDSPDSRQELALQGPLAFNLGRLAPGASQTVSIKASASAAGVYLNNAAVTWSDSTGKLSTATAAASTTVAGRPGDFAASLSAPVALNNGVRQVHADGSTVYVVNNPGESLTILNCAPGACNVTSTVALGTGAQPVALITMDVDGDGQNDALILNQGAGTVGTLLSSHPGAPQVSNVGARPVAFAPFNTGDGVPRIAIAFPGALAIFAWDGQQFQPVTTVTAGASPTALANGDFNGDGADDLLLADKASGTVQLFLGDGAGRLNPAGALPVGANPVALAVGDVDNSGSLDAAVITNAGLVVLINDGVANLAPQPAIPAAGAGDVLLADFNGDGNLDIAVANSGRSSVSLYRGDGSGTFVAAGSYLTGQAPVSLAASDLDYDGTVDLICGNAGSQDLAVLLFSQL
jgi:hypothetical protein